MDYDRPLFYHVMAYAARAEHDVVDMVSGNPDWEPPDALRSGLREYADLDGSRFQYPPSEGLWELREEIADRRDVSVDRVVVTNGTGEANHLAMAAALDPGDEVLLTDPVYPYYAGRAAMLGAETRFVPVEADGTLDPERVRKRATDDTELIALNTPNNPTGAVYDEATLESLVAVAEEFDAVLLSDEVYHDFDYSGRFSSALEFESGNVVVTSGFSKSMAITGFRVGYGIYPPDTVDSVKRRHMLTNVTGSRPAQHAVLRALRNTGPEYYATNRGLVEDRISSFTDALATMGADYTLPDGGFYVMARFEGFPGTLSNAERLIDEAGVAGMPGATFGESRDEWLRFALVTPRVEEAADRLAGFFG